MRIAILSRLFPIAIFALFAGACGVNPPSVNDYDRRCTSDDECALVSSGCECACSTGALHQSEAEDFRAAAQTNCTAVVVTADCVCRLVEPKCVESRCEMVEADCEDESCEVFESL